MNYERKVLFSSLFKTNELERLSIGLLCIVYTSKSQHFIPFVYSAYLKPGIIYSSWLRIPYDVRFCVALCIAIVSTKCELNFLANLNCLLKLCALVSVCPFYSAVMVAVL